MVSTNERVGGSQPEVNELWQIKGFFEELKQSLDEPRQRAAELREQAATLLARSAEYEAAARQQERQKIVELGDILAGRRVVVSGISSAAEGIDLSDSLVPFWQASNGWLTDAKRKIVGVSKGNAINDGCPGARSEGIFLTVEELNRDFGGRGHRVQLRLDSVRQLEFTDNQ